MNTKITKKNICISLIAKQVTFHELEIGNTQLLCAVSYTHLRAHET